MQFLLYRKDPLVTSVCLSVRSLDLTKMPLIPYIIPKIIHLKLFLGLVPSSYSCDMWTVQAALHADTCSCLAYKKKETSNAVEMFMPQDDLHEIVTIIISHS